MCLPGAGYSGEDEIGPAVQSYPALQRARLYTDLADGHHRQLQVLCRFIFLVLRDQQLYVVMFKGVAFFISIDEKLQ